MKQGQCQANVPKLRSVVDPLGLTLAEIVRTFQPKPNWRTVNKIFKGAAVRKGKMEDFAENLAHAEGNGRTREELLQAIGVQDATRPVLDWGWLHDAIDANEQWLRAVKGLDMNSDSEAALNRCKRELRTCATNSSKSLQVQLAQAIVLSNAGRHDDADAVLEKILQVLSTRESPRMLRLWWWSTYHRAVNHRRRKLYGEALALLGELRSDRRNLPKVSTSIQLSLDYQIATIKFRTGKLDDAIRIFNRCYAGWDEPDARHRQALVLRKLGEIYAQRRDDTEKAVGCFLEALLLFDRTDCHRYVAGTIKRMRDHLQAGMLCPEPHHVPPDLATLLPKTGRPLAGRCFSKEDTRSAKASQVTHR